jgi:hypothetical protein
MAQTQTQTQTLDVPGAVLTYDVRRPVRPGPAPTLLMVGSPMGALGFGTLARSFSDRTVVTYDPRGVERSRLVGTPDPATPATHADDLHRLVAAIDGGPVEVFASSGERSTRWRGWQRIPRMSPRSWHTNRRWQVCFPMPR